MLYSMLICRHLVDINGQHILIGDTDQMQSSCSVRTCLGLSIILVFQSRGHKPAHSQLTRPHLYSQCVLRSGEALDCCCCHSLTAAPAVAPPACKGIMLTALNPTALALMHQEGKVNADSATFRPSSIACHTSFRGLKTISVVTFPFPADALQAPKRLGACTVCCFQALKRAIREQKWQ